MAERAWLDLASVPQEHVLTSQTAWYIFRQSVWLQWGKYRQILLNLGQSVREVPVSPRWNRTDSCPEWSNECYSSRRQEADRVADLSRRSYCHCSRVPADSSFVRWLFFRERIWTISRWVVALRVLLVLLILRVRFRLSISLSDPCRFWKKSNHLRTLLHC
jgi:hypothetical protein